MIKTVTIGGKEVKFKSSAAILYLYRQQYGRDLIIDMAKLEANLHKNADGSSNLPIENLQIFEEMAYIFAKHADPEEVPDDIVEWLDQFEAFDIFEVFPVLIDMWAENTKTTSKLKKKNGTSTAK